MKDKKRYFSQGEIESISKILGDTETGLTGSDIERFLIDSQIPDIEPGITKWKRLYNAFVSYHNKKGNGNRILDFIAKALSPHRFINRIEEFNEIVDKLNKVLSFQGLEYRDDGKFHNVKSSESLTEAEKRAKKLRDRIKDRNLHPKLLKYCKAELLEENYFHAVLEASKGISEMIKLKTGFDSDGAKLFDKAFGGDNPLLIINSFITESERSEQKGFVNLLKGLHGMFRNPTAHNLKIEWSMKEEDALDFFSIVSYSYRRIEKST